LLIRLFRTTAELKIASVQLCPLDLAYAWSSIDRVYHRLLTIRQDWLLYNRVGATLANGGRADEALSYYYKALEINPAYIRAR
jgi:peroxin-5